MSDAKKFPFIASSFLFGFYLLFKVLPLTVFTTGVDLYFSISIIASTAGLIFDFIPFSPDQQKVLYTIKLHKYLQKALEIKNIEISIGGLISFAISAVPVGFYFVTKHWILNNILAVLFSIMALKSMSLSTIKTGLLMLWGLFIYDIFWVYGTDVMVTVAKNLNIPIKILFPYLSEEGESKYSMVGLGDIVIPGIFVALCLKIDVENYLKKNKAKNFSEIPLTYFHTCFVGYILGIVETFLVMVLSNHAQPALLFLVPMCTLSVLGMAYYKKEFNEFLNYDADFKIPVEAESNK
jgi:minor histocompatibility antigen H13